MPTGGHGHVICMCDMLTICLLIVPYQELYMENVTKTSHCGSDFGDIATECYFLSDGHVW